jgi:ABC-type sugar transport system ATPase subunit
MVSKKAVSSGVKVKVDVVEYLGEERSLTLGIGGSVLKAIVPIDFLVGESESVWVTADPENVHIFDEESGEALIKTGK